MSSRGIFLISCLGFAVGVLSLAGCAPGGNDRFSNGEQPSFRTERKVLKSAPGTPFSRAVEILRIHTIDGGSEIIAKTLYVSGQVGFDPESGSPVEGGVEAETRQVLKNIESIVSEAGFSLRDAVRCTVYLIDMEDYAAMNEVYREFFPEDPPSRACVGVDDLVADYRVEISLVAER